MDSPIGELIFRVAFPRHGYRDASRPWRNCAIFLPNASCERFVVKSLLTPKMHQNGAIDGWAVIRPAY